MSQQVTPLTKSTNLKNKEICNFMNEFKKMEQTFEKLRQKFEKMQQEFEKIKQELNTNEKNILFISSNDKKETKGSGCSISGNNYEKEIFNIVKNLLLNDKLFNTQNIKELGGSTNANDIQCNFNGEKNIGIEIKKSNTPDWMQCSLKYNNIDNTWEGSTKGKIPEKSRNIFNKLINELNLFDGNIPPFMIKDITHEEWITIKKNTNKWNDYYITIPNDTIKNLYKEKGCYYIQISTYGLFHLGKDICDFNVPEFIVDQQLRIRTKIHARKNTKNFCSLSVTASCQPKNIKLLKKSTYSLDDVNKLPLNLKHIIT
jgi:hypothetical protein